MKRWIALVMLLLVLLPGCAPAEKEPRYRVVETRHAVVNGVPANTELYSYDENDRLAYRALRNAQGNLEYETYFSYERDGNNTWKISKTEMDGALINVDKELLDKNGNVLEYWNITEDGEFALRKTYAYDKAGNKIFERSCHGDSLYTHCWEYDKHGNETRAYSYKGTDDAAVYHDKETFYTYDEHGWPVEVMVCQTGRPGIITVYTNTYRADGTLEYRVGVYEDESYFEENYNAAGTREYFGYFSASGRLREKTVWEFDEHGNVIATEEWSGNVMIFRTEMVYEAY